MGNLDSSKIVVIDYAFSKFGIKSFADLGGVWGVDGGYTFYILEKYVIDKTVLVDTNISDKVVENQKKFLNLTLISGNFGDDEVLSKVGRVDAIIFFDVLLHQVKPNWDEIIKMYSKITSYFIVYNQQFIGDKTVRLLDLGEEEYFKNIPHKRDEGPYKVLMEKMYDICPEHNRIYRDIHNVWQWGITDKDLIDVMKINGFDRVFYENTGQWGNLENFEGHSFIFKKNA